ncbi:MAG TPA: hypothetical protein PK431_09410 [Chitinophagales bacterium]|nr:hypothetical protein [Chitinophagales bacterium]
MKKYLQTIFLLFIISFSAIAYAQTERLKTAQKQAIPVNSTNTKSVVENNKQSIPTKEKPKVPKPVTTSTKTDANKTVIQIPQKQSKDLRKPKVITEVVEPTDNNQKQTVDVVNPDVNVTYTKEVEPTQTASNAISERKPTTMQKSVNYQPKVVKEDIHPIIDYSNTSTPPNKKIYLQQEADDLQAEIDQNRNNPSYDLIAKQKQLDDIKKLIQQ